MIVIAIVGSRSGCSCCYYGVLVALGGKDVTMVKGGHFVISSWRDLQQQQRFERQPLGGLQDLGGKNVMMTKVLTEDVSAMLMMIKNCTNKQTRVRLLL